MVSNDINGNGNGNGNEDGDDELLGIEWEQEVEEEGEGEGDGEGEEGDDINFNTQEDDYLVTDTPTPTPPSLSSSLLSGISTPTLYSSSLSNSSIGDVDENEKSIDIFVEVPGKKKKKAAVPQDPSVKIAKLKALNLHKSVLLSYLLSFKCCVNSLKDLRLHSLVLSKIPSKLVHLFDSNSNNYSKQFNHIVIELLNWFHVDFNLNINDKIHLPSILLNQPTAINDIVDVDSFVFNVDLVGKKKTAVGLTRHLVQQIKTGTLSLHSFVCIFYVVCKILGIRVRLVSVLKTPLATPVTPAKLKKLNSSISPTKRSSSLPNLSDATSTTSTSTTPKRKRNTSSSSKKSNSKKIESSESETGSESESSDDSDSESDDNDTDIDIDSDDFKPIKVIPVTSRQKALALKRASTEPITNNKKKRNNDSDSDSDSDKKDKKKKEKGKGKKKDKKKEKKKEKEKEKDKKKEKEKEKQDLTSPKKKLKVENGNNGVKVEENIIKQENMIKLDETDHGVDFWCELMDPLSMEWITVDVVNNRINKPGILEPEGKPFAYVLAYNDEHIKEVTNKYTNNIIASVLRRLPAGPPTQWWQNILEPLNPDLDDIANQNENNSIIEMESKIQKPQSLSSFKSHPLFMLDKDIPKYSSLQPGAKSIGKFKDHLIYHKSHIKTLHVMDKWIQNGRMVKHGEQPVKVVKAKKTSSPTSHLFGEWQTKPYEPGIIVDGIVPMNTFNNVYMFKPEMIPFGGVHLKSRGMVRVARKLGISVGPAIIGWEVTGCHRPHPIIQGVIVAKENSKVLIEAWVEDHRNRVKESIKKIHNETLARWKNFYRALLIREYIQTTYGGKEEIVTNTNKLVQADVSEGAEDKKKADQHHHRDRSNQSETKLLMLAKTFFQKDGNTSYTLPKSNGNEDDTIKSKSPKKKSNTRKQTNSKSKQPSPAKSKKKKKQQSDSEEEEEEDEELEEEEVSIFDDDDDFKPMERPKRVIKRPIDIDFQEDEEDEDSEEEQMDSSDDYIPSKSKKKTTPTKGKKKSSPKKSRK